MVGQSCHVFRSSVVGLLHARSGFSDCGHVGKQIWQRIHARLLKRLLLLLLASLFTVVLSIVLRHPAIEGFISSLGLFLRSLVSLCFRPRTFFASAVSPMPLMGPQSAGGRSEDLGGSLSDGLFCLVLFSCWVGLFVSRVVSSHRFWWSRPVWHDIASDCMVLRDIICPLCDRVLIGRARGDD